MANTPNSIATDTFSGIYNSNSGDGPNAFGKAAARIGGSTTTIFTWNNAVIAFAKTISHQSPEPVAQGAVPIHPLDSPVPVQLVTPVAISMGTLTLELYELFGQNVWDRLGNTTDQTKPVFNPPFALDGIVDLGGIFLAVANSAPIHIYRVIIPQNNLTGSLNPSAMSPYTEEFHNCVVSALDDGESIAIGTMEITKTITVNYTHKSQNGKNALLDKQVGSFSPS